MNFFNSINPDSTERQMEPGTQTAESTEEVNMCDDCGHNLVTSRFLHLDGREFFLCDVCFQAADHAEDYGRTPNNHEHEFINFDEQDDDEDGFIDPGEQDDDFEANEKEFDEGYVGSDDWWGDEIDEMRMNGTYSLLTRLS